MAIVNDAQALMGAAAAPSPPEITSPPHPRDLARRLDERQLSGVTCGWVGANQGMHPFAILRRHLLHPAQTKPFPPAQTEPSQQPQTQSRRPIRPLYLKRMEPLTRAPPNNSLRNNLPLRQHLRPEHHLRRRLLLRRDPLPQPLWSIPHDMSGLDGRSSKMYRRLPVQSSCCEMVNPCPSYPIPPIYANHGNLVEKGS